MDAEMRAKIGELPEDQSQRPKKKRRGRSAVDHLSGCGFTANSFIPLLPSYKNNPLRINVV